MNKNLFISLLCLLLSSIVLQASGEFRTDFSDKPFLHLFKQKDSSNYKIKTLKTEINYSQLRFTIVDELKTPLDGIISLLDVNKKGISGVFLNEDGKIYSYGLQ